MASGSGSNSGSGSGSGHGSYDELYGVGLLDDLHNYFPALLYEPDGFDDVESVLRYVARQTQGRFDLYAFGRDAYYENLRQQRMTLLGRSERSSVGIRHQIYPNVIEIANGLQPSASQEEEDEDDTDEEQTQADVGAAQEQSQTREPPSLRARVSTRVINMDTSNMSQTLPLSRSILSALLGTEMNLPMENTYPPVERRLMSLTNLANLAALLNAPPLPSGFLEPVRVPPTAAQIATATETTGITLEEGDACSICQDGFQENTGLLRIKHCGHLFHQDCIGTWFQQNATCPTCRYDIRDHGQPSEPATVPSLASTSPDADFH